MPYQCCCLATFGYKSQQSNFLAPAMILKKIKMVLAFTILKKTELFLGNFLLKSVSGKGCEIIVEIPVPT